MTQKERSKRHYENNKQLYKDRAIQWYRDNKAVNRVPELLSNTEKTFKRQQLNPKGHIWSRSRSSSQRRGHEFSIGVEDFELPLVCPYFGFVLQFNRTGKQQNSYSLDRIDSSKGYVPGNVEVISDLANRMKAEATPEQLVAFAREVLRRYEISTLG